MLEETIEELFKKFLDFAHNRSIEFIKLGEKRENIRISAPQHLIMLIARHVNFDHPEARWLYETDYKQVFGIKIVDGYENCFVMYSVNSPLFDKLPVK